MSNEWISVEDRLPSDKLDVVIIYTGNDEDKFVLEAEWEIHNEEGAFWLDAHDQYYYPHLSVTHWMPLPSPPDTGEK